MNKRRKVIFIAVPVLLLVGFIVFFAIQFLSHPFMFISEVNGYGESVRLENIKKESGVKLNFLSERISTNLINNETDELGAQQTYAIVPADMLLASPPRGLEISTVKTKKQNDNIWVQQIYYSRDGEKVLSYQLTNCGQLANVDYHILEKVDSSKLGSCDLNFRIVRFLNDNDEITVLSYEKNGYQCLIEAHNLTVDEITMAVNKVIG